MVIDDGDGCCTGSIGGGVIMGNGYIGVIMVLLVVELVIMVAVLVTIVVLETRGNTDL